MQSRSSSSRSVSSGLRGSAAAGAGGQEAVAAADAGELAGSAGGGDADALFADGLAFDMQGSCAAVSLSPSDEFVAVGGRDVFKVLSTDGNRLSLKQSVRRKRQGNLNSSTNDIKWHPMRSYENWIATAATNGVLVVWDLSLDGASRHISVLRDHARTVNRVCWHPKEATTLLSASQDGTIKVWDIRLPEKDACVSTFVESQYESVRDVQVNPRESSQFAAACGDGRVVVWKMSYPNQPEYSFTAHKGLVLGLDWHPDDANVLASGGQDRAIRVWDLQSPSKARHTIQTIASVARVAWRPHHAYQIASSSSLMDMQVHLWDVNEPYVPLASWTGHRQVATGIAWFQSGDELVSCSKDNTVMLNFTDKAYNPRQHLRTVAVSWNAMGFMASLRDPIDRTPIHEQTGEDGARVFRQLANGQQSPSGGDGGQRLFGSSVAGASAAPQAAASPLLFSTSWFGGGGTSNSASETPPPLDTRSGMSHLELGAAYKADLGTIRIMWHPPHGALSDEEAFRHFARHYKLGGMPVHELCQHNSHVALLANRLQMAKVWDLIGMMFGSDDMLDELVKEVEDECQSARRPEDEIGIGKGTLRRSAGRISCGSYESHGGDVHSSESSEFLSEQDMEDDHHIALQLRQLSEEEERMELPVESADGADHANDVNGSAVASGQGEEEEEEEEDGDRGDKEKDAHRRQQQEQEEEQEGDQRASNGTRSDEPVPGDGSVQLDGAAAGLQQPEQDSEMRTSGLHVDLDDGDMYGLIAAGSFSAYAGNGIDMEPGDDAHIIDLPMDAMNDDFVFDDEPDDMVMFELNQPMCEDEESAQLGKAIHFLKANPAGTLRQDAQDMLAFSSGVERDFRSTLHAGLLGASGEIADSPVPEKNLFDESSSSRLSSAAPSEAAARLDERRKIMQSCLPAVNPQAVMRPAVIDDGFREEMVRNFLVHCTEVGDIQSCVAVAFVLRDIIELEKHQFSHWCYCYIQLLQRHELFSQANEIISHCGVKQVGNLNRKTTSVYISCPSCNRSSQHHGLCCTHCKANMTKCSVCQEPVRGALVWCQGCGHGGHLQHMKEWFAVSTQCPAGCLHKCSSFFR